MSRVSRDPSTIPTPLYKGAAPEHVHEMLVRGQIRVGTLSGYRTMEQSTPGVGDADDARREIAVPIAMAEQTRYGDLPYPLNALGFLHPDAIASFDFRDCTVDDSCPDALVVCTATTLEGGQMLYPAGVEIKDPLSFGRLIDRELRARKLIQGSFIAGRCVYVDHVQDYRGLADVPVVFQKGPRFVGQDEYRFAWSPACAPLPIVIDVPEITALLVRAW